MFDSKHGKIIRSALIATEVTETGEVSETWMRSENRTYVSLLPTRGAPKFVECLTIFDWYGLSQKGLLVLGALTESYSGERDSPY